MSEATLLERFLDHRVRALGQSLRYAVSGSGAPIVLVHGLGGAAENWSELGVGLAAEHRVLVPDLPGHGLSAPLLQGRGGMRPFVDAVLQCMADAGIARAVLVGHSFGGLVALRTALAQPQIVRGLVLASAAGISSGSARNRAALAFMTRVRPSRLGGPLGPLIVASRLARRLAFAAMISDARSLSREGTQGFLIGATRATDTRTAAEAMIRDDVRPELDQLSAPALVLWGARDFAQPVDDGIEYSRRLRAPLRILADTGHLLIGERPRECAELIRGFAERLPADGPRPEVRSEVGDVTLGSRAEDRSDAP